MPRLACPEEPRVALHVVQRGRARSACFSCAVDRTAYLRALRECAECAPAPCRVCKGNGLQPHDEAIASRLTALWDGAA